MDFRAWKDGYHPHSFRGDGYYAKATVYERLYYQAGKNKRETEQRLSKLKRETNLFGPSYSLSIEQPHAHNQDSDAEIVVLFFGSFGLIVGVIGILFYFQDEILVALLSLAAASILFFPISRCTSLFLENKPFLERLILAAVLFTAFIGMCIAEYAIITSRAPPGTLVRYIAHFVELTLTGNNARFWLLAMGGGTAALVGVCCARSKQQLLLLPLAVLGAAVIFAIVVMILIPLTGASLVDTHHLADTATKQAPQANPRPSVTETVKAPHIR
jgi:hypothetical protein